jgi:hypothetical protein
LDQPLLGQANGLRATRSGLTSNDDRGTNSPRLSIGGMREDQIKHHRHGGDSQWAIVAANWYDGRADPTVVSFDDLNEPVKMLAIGCFVPFVLLAAGAAIGAAVGGNTDAYWGCAVGLLVGVVLVFIAFRWLDKLRNGRRR